LFEVLLLPNGNGGADELLYDNLRNL
jgi:hypothetical protein